MSIASERGAQTVPATDIATCYKEAFRIVWLLFDQDYADDRDEDLAPSTGPPAVVQLGASAPVR